MSFVAVAVGVGVASAGVSLAAQSQAARQQNAYRRSLGISQNEQYAKNAQAVTRDVGFQIDQLAQREIETVAATRLELEKVSRDARESGATARTMTAAAGIEGRTVDILHAQFRRDVADFESVTARNLRNYRAQSAMEAKAIYARGQNAINNGYPQPLPPVATISPATSIMQGLTTGLSVYGTLGGLAKPDLGAAANATTAAPPPYFLARNSPVTPPYFLAR